jgi:hypothetical protein
MGSFGYYLVTAFFFMIYMAFSWVITGVLHLSGNAEMMARMFLMAVGMGAFGYIFYFIADRRISSAPWRRAARRVCRSPAA